jgi:hypothetical protein
LHPEEHRHNGHSERFSFAGKDPHVDKDELTNWALANGWQMIGGCLSLTKPSAPKEAIVRMVLKATVVNLEVKRPAGKWQKIAGESYSKIKSDPETGLPRGVGFDTISGFTQLMEDNKNRSVFANMARSSKTEDVD